MRPKSFFLLLHSSLAIFLLLFHQSLGIVCRKGFIGSLWPQKQIQRFPQTEKVGPFGVGDFRGGMNADCGQYVRHCLKVLPSKTPHQFNSSPFFADPNVGRERHTVSAHAF